MKIIQIRRHAPKHVEGNLTDKGRLLAQKIKEKLPKFDLIISSNKPRCIETAKLLTGQEPTIDKRAGTPPFSLEQEKELHIFGEKHSFGIAGVIFDNPKYRELIIIQGEKVVELIKETFDKLPKDGKALIISHDGVMVSTEKILKGLTFDKAGKTIGPLQGFEVDEEMKVKELS